MTLSDDPLISGEYSFNKYSSLRSNEWRDPAYTNIISWLGWAVAKIRTAVSSKIRNPNFPLYFPMIMVSVVLYQKLADYLVVATNWIP